MKNTKHYMFYYSDKIYTIKHTIFMINTYKKEKWGNDFLKSYFDLDTIK